MRKKHIIIGTSAAGIAAATTLRQLNKEDEIMCITQEAEVPYNKCFLVDYVAQRKNLDQVNLKKGDFFEAQAINLLFNTTITHLDVDHRKIVDENGQSYPYDTLLLATGSKLRHVLPSAFYIASNCFSFHTMHDINAILAYCQNNTVRNVIIIGAGFTGLECADAMVVLGKTVTIFERGSRVLSHFLDESSADVVQASIRRYCTLYTNCTVQDFTFAQTVITHLTTNYGVHTADMIIMALGSEPNSTMAMHAEIATISQGIVINEMMQTNIQNIYAAGDNCAVLHAFTKDYVRTTTWPEALVQGSLAARAMLGLVKAYSGLIPYSTSSFFGIDIIVAGLFYHQISDQYIQDYSTGEAVKRYFIKNNCLQGYILIGSSLASLYPKQLLYSQAAIDYQRLS